jgi:hypothetical protein
MEVVVAVAAEGTAEAHPTAAAEGTLKAAVEGYDSSA